MRRPDRVWIPLVASAAAAVLLYLPTLRHGFAYDDGITVVENPLVREGRFREILLAPYHAGPSQRIPTGLYRPLTTWTFAGQNALQGMAPWGYHAGNVLLHGFAAALAAAVAFFAVGSLAGREAEAGTAALLAGLLFAVHPVHVEAVANVSGRAEILSAALGLGALLTIARLRRPGGGPTPLGWTLAAALLFLACLAKETAVMVAPVAAFWELLRSRRLRDGGRALAIAAVPVVLYLALRVAALGSLVLRDDAVTFLENPVVGQSLPVRWMTALAVAGRAAGLLFLPLELTPDYGFAHVEPATRPRDLAVLAGVGVLAAAAWAVARLWKRRPDAAFGVALIVAPWFLVSNLVVTIGTIFGERLLYLPSAGFSLVVGAGTASLDARRRRPLLAGTVALLLLLAAVRAGTYAETWADDFTLFSSAERVAPRSVRILANLGTELAVRGRLAEAEERLVRARDLAPWVVPVRINLAGVYLHLGRLEEAEREAMEAVRLAPEDPIARAQLEAIR